MNAFVKNFKELRMTDVEEVGGKNASLGEMVSQLSTAGVRVPGGFATTAEAYRAFLAHNGLAEKINARLASLDVDDVDALLKTGAEIRQWVVETPFRNNWKKKLLSTMLHSLPRAAPKPRLPSARRPLPKICRMLRLPVSRKPSSIFMAWKISCTPSRKCSHRFTTIVPLPTVSIKGLHTPMSRSRLVFSVWCGPIRGLPA